MNEEEKELIELREKLDKLIEIRKFARIFGGNANIGGQNVTEIELNACINEVKHQIKGLEEAAKSYEALN